MMNWREFSLQSQLILSVRDREQVWLKCFMKETLAYSSWESRLRLKGCGGRLGKGRGWASSIWLRSKSLRIRSMSRGEGSSSMESIFMTAANLFLSLGSTLKKWTTERQLRMMGTAWQKLEQCRSSRWSMSSPETTTIFFSSLASSGELDLWKRMPKSTSMGWQLTVSTLLFLRGRRRQTASSLSELALLNRCSFLAVASLWQTQTMLACACRVFHTLPACSSTDSSPQKYPSSTTRLADITTMVSLPSELRFRTKFFNLQCAFFSPCSSSSCCSLLRGRFSPFSSSLPPSSRVGPSNLRLMMSFSRLRRSSRRSVSWGWKATGTMLRVSRMWWTSFLRWELLVFSLILSSSSFFSWLIWSRYFSRSISREQYSSTDRFIPTEDTGSSGWDSRRPFLQTMLTLRIRAITIRLQLLSQAQSQGRQGWEEDKGVVGWRVFFGKWLAFREWLQILLSA